MLTAVPDLSFGLPRARPSASANVLPIFSAIARAAASTARCVVNGRSTVTWTGLPNVDARDAGVALSFALAAAAGAEPTSARFVV